MPIEDPIGHRSVITMNSKMIGGKGNRLGGGELKEFIIIHERGYRCRFYKNITNTYNDVY